jgi:GH35 family endo-1,4-beta-xylanase
MGADDDRVVNDERLWNEANQRIERHRKAEVVIEVVDAGGRPVSNAGIHLQQTRHAFLFGSNIFNWDGIADASLQREYRDRFAEFLNFATLPFYWPSYERQSGLPMHGQREQVARWCAEHDIICKGHPLAWNYSDPHWLPDDSARVFRLQQGRIVDCIDRFHGLIDTWDVVNEPTHVDRDQFLRRAPKITRMWMKLGQVEFTKRCFEAARRAGPDATLLINDYRVDAAYAKVIEQLVDSDGKPLYDAIGIQSHQHASTWTNSKIWEVCDRFSRFGVPLHFTETTILSGQLGWRSDDQRAPWPSTEEGETYQAKEVERFYTMLYSHPAVEAITWWDFSDARAWKRAPAGLLRADMTPKPAYETLRRLIRETWSTDARIATDSSGQASCRATYGDYQLTVSANGHEPVSVAATIARDGASNLRVRLP